MKGFETEIDIQWRDCDPNMHVRHSAYYDYGAHIRIQYFLEIGFSVERMKALKIGPILFREECSFLREIKPEDKIRINLLRGDVRPDGSRWTFYHEIFGNDGSKAAHLTVEGAWLDLEKRKLAVPPKELANAFFDLPRGEAFVFKKKEN